MQKTTYSNKSDYVEVTDGFVTKVGSNDKIGTWFSSVDRNCPNLYFFTSSLEAVLDEFPLELLQEVKNACPDDPIIIKLFNSKYLKLKEEIARLQSALTVWTW